MVNRYFK